MVLGFIVTYYQYKVNERCPSPICYPLRCTYEEVNYPGTDFVILARPEEHVWQMAALGEGSKVAVFRYAGQEDLAQHLGVLAQIVQ